jgi:hypothetical protein
MESYILLTRDPQILALSARPLLMVEIRTVSLASMHELAVSRERGKTLCMLGLTEFKLY